MHPLKFGKNLSKPTKFDLTKGPTAAFLAKETRPSALVGGGVIATITPKGPRLNLEPVLDRVIISSPDEGAEEQGVVDGIHLPQGSVAAFNAYARVKVLAVAPSINSVKVGDEILVVKPQCEKAAFDGNDYWYTTEVAIIGIVRP